MLVKRWRRVLLHAWSMWPVYISIALQIAEGVIPYVSDCLPRWVPVAILITSPLFRIISQGGIDADKQDSADEAR